MYIRELIKAIQIRPLMYLQQEKLDYLYHYLEGHCELAMRYNMTSEMDKHFSLWFVKWLTGWILENRDSKYVFKTFHWNEMLKEVTNNEKEALQLFYLLCDRFFGDYEAGTGYFDWKNKEDNEQKYSL